MPTPLPAPASALPLLRQAVVAQPGQAAPAAPAQPGQTWVIHQSEVPKTGQQVEAIRVRLDDLRRELQDAAERRNAISSRMREAPERALPGLEARLAEVDARILMLEREITRNGSMLQQAPPEALIAGTVSRPDPGQVIGRVVSDIVPIVAILSIFVFAPIAFSIARFFWRRGGAPRVAPPDQATQQKLEHLQQAVDTIAIEVERISEGQRFVTRLLSERSLATGGGAAEPVNLRNRAAIERP